jgi:tRNA A37 threonylcarbamoyltransferase TsaD
MEYCLDNAAMIAGLAAERLMRDEVDDLTLSAAARSVL